MGVVVEGEQGTSADPACQVGERFVGVELPLRCRGPLEMGAKACRIDRDGLVQVAAKLAGDRIRDKIDEKLEENWATRSTPNSKTRCEVCSTDEPRAVFQRRAGMVRPQRPA